MVIFDKKMSEYQYCKIFWGLSEKNELKTNVFWDDFENISVAVVIELTSFIIILVITILSFFCFEKRLIFA